MVPGSLAYVAGLLRILVNLAEWGRGGRPGRLRPIAQAAVYRDVFGDGRHCCRDEVRRLLVHEVEVAGPPRRNHRLSECHRLCHRQAEAFRSVKRYDAIAGIEHCPDRVLPDVAVKKMDVRPRRMESQSLGARLTADLSV